MTYTTKQMADQLNITVDQAYQYASMFEPPAKEFKNRYRQRNFSDTTMQKVSDYVNFRRTYIGTQTAAKILKLNSRAIYYWATHDMIPAICKQHHSYNYYYLKRSELGQIKKMIDQIQTYHLLPLSEIMHQLNLTQNECLQIVNKYQIKSYHILNDAKVSYYQIDDFKAHTNLIQQLKQKRKKSTVKQLNPKTKSTSRQRVFLADLAHDLNINPKVLYAMATRNKIPTEKDPNNKRLTTDIKTAQYFKAHYLKYPNEPIYTATQLAQQYQVSTRRIKSAMYHGQIEFTTVLGDSKAYITKTNALKIKQLLSTLTYRPRKHKVKKLIQNTNDKPNSNDFSINQVSRKLGCKPNHVENWAQNQWVEYQYNGIDLFFTPQQVDKMAHQYLNYPHQKCIDKQTALKLTNLSTNPPKFKRYCQKFNVNSIKVLGDTRRLYPVDEITRLQQSIQKFER